MIHMPLKWHHIDKCNKNYIKIDVLTSISTCLSSFTPITQMVSFIHIGEEKND